MKKLGLITISGICLGSFACTFLFFKSIDAKTKKEETKPVVVASVEKPMAEVKEPAAFRETIIWAWVPMRKMDASGKLVDHKKFDINFWITDPETGKVKMDLEEFRLSKEKLEEWKKGIKSNLTMLHKWINSRLKEEKLKEIKSRIEQKIEMAIDNLKKMDKNYIPTMKEIKMEVIRMQRGGDSEIKPMPEKKMYAKKIVAKKAVTEPVK